MPPPWSVRWYRRLLVWLPSRERARYGEEMVEVFAQEWRDTRPRARPAFFVRAVVGVVWSGVAMRISGSGRLPRSITADLTLDLRHAVRGVLRRPGSAVAIVASLVLGIGLNTAVFSLVNGLLLRPLPYSDADRLVQLSETAPGIESMDVSLPDFHLWRAETRVFDGMFAFDDGAFLLTDEDRPEVVEGAWVSPGYLEVLGLSTTLGRDFLDAEERPGEAPVVIISHALWERRFGRSPDVLERELMLDGVARRIVGVAPPAFHFPEVAHVWVPLAFDPLRADAEDYGFDVIARMASGVNLSEARTEGERIAAMLAERSPATKASIGTTMYSLRAADVPVAVGAVVVTLLVAALLVMLVACANVSSLLLARGEDRRHEMAVRRALGAGRRRLLRQILTEVGLLSLLGVGGALLVAHQAMAWLPGILPAERPFWIHFDLDRRVFAWTAAMGMVCGAAIAWPTAFQAASERRLATGGRATSGRRFSSWIVGAQVAFATTLIACAGLTLRALHNLNTVDPGLDVDQVLVLSTPLPSWSYPDDQAREALFREVLERVRAMPGVVSAAAVDAVPFLSTGQEVALEAGEASSGPAPIGVLSRFSDGYFASLGVRVVEGRLPAQAEAWDGRAVAVVSASLARRFWPGESAIGRRVRHGVEGSRSPTVDDGQRWYTVVAVVDDVLQSGPGHPTRDAVYLPMGTGAPRAMTLLVRTVGPPLAAVDAVRERVHDVDATLPFYQPTTMELARRFSIWSQRTVSALLAVFGALAVVLSAIGVYGVVSHVTRRRRREIGVRCAVGAAPSEVRAMVVRSALGLILPGLAVGVVFAGAVSVFARALLFGVGPLDPLSFLGTAVVFIGAGLVASYGPARRAVRLDPAMVLKSDV